jgi:hypothetical protein
MYVVTVVLFLVPCILICIGWGRRALHQKTADAPTWRDRCMVVSFVSGILGALVGMAAELFWLHGGGNPHGMGSAPGVWQQLLTSSRYAFLLTFILAILGKGTGRIFVLGALATASFADVMVQLLQFQ